MTRTISHTHTHHRTLAQGTNKNTSTGRRITSVFFCSAECVLPVRGHILYLLHVAEVEEVRWPVQFVVELKGVGQLYVIAHVGRVLDTHEVVVPRAHTGGHEEAQEAVRQQHLHLLVEGRHVAVRVAAAVLVVLAPLKPRGGQLVRRQGARARSKAAGDHNGLLTVPLLVVGHDLCMHGHVLWCQLGQLIWLGVDPAQWLKVLEVLVLRQTPRKVHLLVCAPLRDHNNGPDLVDLRVVWGVHPVHEARDLCAQIRDDNKLLEDVLGQHVRESCLLDVVRGHVDVRRAQVEVGGADGAHTPLRL
eukprot:comp24100_c1_seq1/m.43518 comp24100_c1_seq1/g.43518  ORF comp24100_c1_seq1/g.43518 comp24100_c1_seq1/m.43518 type:complete len:303 (+) comp24100_c1_seq1:521-1429(+)